MFVVVVSREKMPKLILKVVTSNSFLLFLICHAQMKTIQKHFVGPSVLDSLENKRRKARGRYAKLTDEQKALRNAKRREDRALKKIGRTGIEISLPN